MEDKIYFCVANCSELILVYSAQWSIFIFLGLGEYLITLDLLCCSQSMRCETTIVCTFFLKLSILLVVGEMLVY